MYLVCPDVRSENFHSIKLPCLISINVRSIYADNIKILLPSTETLSPQPQPLLLPTPTTASPSHLPLRPQLLEEIREQVGWKRYLLRLVGPPMHALAVRRSPYAGTGRTCADPWDAVERRWPAATA